MRFNSCLLARIIYFSLGLCGSALTPSPPARAHARARPPGARELFSKESDEEEVGPKNGKVIVSSCKSEQPEFKRELKGCVENSKIDLPETEEYRKPDLRTPRKRIYAEKSLIQMI